MRAFLMHKDRYLDVEQELPSNCQSLAQDLELETLFNAMAAGDDYFYNVARQVIFASLTDQETIVYRQEILRDCQHNPGVVREIYDIVVDTLKNRRKYMFGITTKNPSFLLSTSVKFLQMLTGRIRRLKIIADKNSGKFHSEGFTAFFRMLTQELNDDYFSRIQRRINEMQFPDGILISAELDYGNGGSNYVLRRLASRKQTWLHKLMHNKPSVNAFRVSIHDESGLRTLAELKARGINLVANALAQSTDHILNFFQKLQPELAFYLACLNLAKELSHIGVPIAYPLAISANERRHCFKELYDVCLALTKKQKIVGNTIDADKKDLVVITGANQGGKSTFLRSIGLAQLMMQAGMFVPAENLTANLCPDLYTHYRREEDVTMKSGKLDEELSRMSEIVETLKLDSLVLLNESFAATNEREGSEIARQIVSALVEKGVKVFFVTHLYNFANNYYSQSAANAIFLRAERHEDGSRTFKVTEGRPLQTSYGTDLYKQIFEGLGLS